MPFCQPRGRKGWCLCWFSLHDGVLSYSKIARRVLLTVPSGNRICLIGNSSSIFSSYSRGGCGCRQSQMPVRLVQLKGRYLDTMLHLEALLAFKLRQWQAIVLLFLDAFFVQRLPSLAQHLANVDVLHHKGLSQTFCGASCAICYSYIQGNTL